MCRLRWRLLHPLALSGHASYSNLCVRRDSRPRRGIVRQANLRDQARHTIGPDSPYQRHRVRPLVRENCNGCSPPSCRRMWRATAIVLVILRRLQLITRILRGRELGANRLKRTSSWCCRAETRLQSAPSSERSSRSTPSPLCSRSRQALPVWARGLRWY